MTAPLPGTAARVSTSGAITQLGLKASADQTITETDVKDPAKLTRLLVKLLADVATLRRRFAPRRMDFEDVTVGVSAAVVNLQHNFNGRVRWWIVGWQGTGSSAPVLRENTNGTTTFTTSTTLSLQSFVAGVATIRVEEAG